MWFQMNMVSWLWNWGENDAVSGSLHRPSQSVYLMQISFPGSRHWWMGSARNTPPFCFCEHGEKYFCGFKMPFNTVKHREYWLVIVLEEIHSNRLDHLTTERESEKLREGFSSSVLQQAETNKNWILKANFVTTSKQCGYKWNCIHVNAAQPSNFFGFWNQMFVMLIIN